MALSRRQLLAGLGIIILAGGGYYLWQKIQPATFDEKLARIAHDSDTREVTRFLEQVLEDPDPRIRTQAALAVGRIGDPDKTDLLSKRLRDSSLEVAGAAAFGLGIAGQKQYATTLLDMAESMPASVAEQAVRAAGRLVDTGNSEQLDRLTAYLNSPAPQVREAACFAMVSAQARSRAFELLTFAAAEPDSLVREAALYALARLGIPEAAPLYVEFLPDVDPFVRATAVRGLGVAASGDPVHYLAIALNDADPAVVAAAIAALNRRPESTAVESLARKLPTFADPRLTEAALEVLETKKTDLAIDYALALLTDSPSVAVTASVLTYLAAAEGERAITTIDSVLEGRPAPLIRAAGAEAYGIVGSPGLLTRLQRLAADPSPQVRLAAFTALTKGDMTNLEFYIKQALVEDTDWVVKSAAVEKIGELRLAGYLDELQTCLTDRVRHPADHRRTVVETLGKLIVSADDSETVRLLDTALTDPDYIVRRDAAKIYEDQLGISASEMVGSARTRVTLSELEDGYERFAEKNPRAIIQTARGKLTCELFFDVAPLTVLQFIELAKSKYYNGVSFHRVIAGFVAQGGDPRGDGYGGPNWRIRCEYSPLRFERGTLGIATSGKDTGGSQFFITLSPQPHLDGRYTIFGQVVDGMEIADRLIRGDTIVTITIEDKK